MTTYTDIQDYIDSEEDLQGTYPKSNLLQQIKQALLNESADRIGRNPFTPGYKVELAAANAILTNPDVYANRALSLILSINNNQYWTPVSNNNPISDDAVQGVITSLYSRIIGYDGIS